LLVVDLQNDFAHPNGSIYVPDGEAIIFFLMMEIRLAQSAGSQVVFTQKWQPRESPLFDEYGGEWPAHCVADTWGAELVAGLETSDAALVRRESSAGHSAFAGGELETLIRGHGSTRIQLAGLPAELGIRDTALDAISLGFEVNVILDGVRPLNRSESEAEAAFESILAAGVQLE
jgi:nicotinamidase/pyrazinamidase